MDPCLTQPVQVSLPVWNTYSRVPSIPGYKQVSTRLPILETFLGTLPATEGQLESSNYFGRTIEFKGSGDCVIETATKEKVKSFCKVIHILDPVRSLQGYYNHPEKGERRIKEKTSNPNNQAYIDCLANYLFGQLAVKGISPHFCRFYGAFQGVADLYRYNITESFESYRKYRSFWDKKRNGLFSLYTEDNESLLNTPRSSLHSRSFSYSTTDSYESDKSHISILGPVVSDDLGELESVDEIRALSDSESDSTYSEYDSDDEDGPLVFSEFKKYPTVLIFQEKMDGVLEDRKSVV